MVRRAVLALAAALAAGALGVLPRAAVEAAPRSDAVAVQHAAAPHLDAEGYDVSFPQCGTPLPSGQAFAVVGVNAGIGTSTNPCLADELAWADLSSGATGQPAAAVYVNTANPGQLGSWWPRSDRTRTGARVENPHGRCTGAEDAACAYVYGWSIAADDAFARGVTDPAERFWWLDVETMNTWSWNTRTNTAVLQGMAALLQRIGGGVGLYSTHRQWTTITGGGDMPAELEGLPDWLSGATTAAEARAHCASAPLTRGGVVTVVQWVTPELDGDLACPQPTAGPAPLVSGRAAVGGDLIVAAGTWRPRDVSLGFQWLRDGSPIPGATARDHAVTAADAGADLAVVVTGSRAGAAPVSRRSATLHVPAPVTGPHPASTGLLGTR
jgi:hypothetical protein